METNYKIVNLINGLNIVGDVEYTPEEIIVKFPLEVTAKPIMNDDGNLVGEHMVLRPYLVMTDDREVFIDQFSVVSSCSLSSHAFPRCHLRIPRSHSPPAHSSLGDPQHRLGLVAITSLPSFGSLVLS